MIFEIAPIKIIITLFVVFAWSRAFLQYRKKLMNSKEIIFWTVLWVSVLIAVYIPGKTTFLANFLGMGRGFDAMIFIGVVILFYVVYRLYVKANEIELEITEIIRQTALRLDTKKRARRRKK